MILIVSNKQEINFTKFGHCSKVFTDKFEIYNVKKTGKTNKVYKKILTKSTYTYKHHII